MKKDLLVMQMRILMVTTLILCLSLGAAAEEWTVWIDDGKSDPIHLKDYQPSTNLLDGYFDALKQICRWNVEDYDHPNSPEERAPYARDKITVTPIGKWEGYEVFEYALKDIKQKSIVLLDNEGHYWMLYAIFGLAPVNSSPLPAILSVDHQAVLAYETECDGNAHYEVRHYFVYDSDTRRPKAVDESLIEKAAKEAVPKGYCIATMQTDHLDIRNLRYVRLVGRSGDERQASGGEIDIEMKLKEGVFHPAKVNYIPPVVLGHITVLNPDESTVTEEFKTIDLGEGNRFRVIDQNGSVSSTGSNKFVEPEKFMSSVDIRSIQISNPIANAEVAKWPDKFDGPIPTVDATISRLDGGVEHHRIYATLRVRYTSPKGGGNSLHWCRIKEIQFDK